MITLKEVNVKYSSLGVPDATYKGVIRQTDSYTTRLIIDLSDVAGDIINVGLNAKKADGSTNSSIGLIMCTAIQGQVKKYLVDISNWYTNVPGTLELTIQALASYNGSTQVFNCSKIQFSIEGVAIDLEDTVIPETYYVLSVQGRTGVVEIPSENISVQEAIDRLDAQTDIALAATEAITQAEQDLETYVATKEAELETYVDTSLDAFRVETDAHIEAELLEKVNGTPKGVFATVDALTTAFPSGTTGIYVVAAGGHWYYYNSSIPDWVDGGVYQATEIENESITYKEISDEIITHNKISETLKNSLKLTFIKKSLYEHGSINLVNDVYTKTTVNTRVITALSFGSNTMKITLTDLENIGLKFCMYKSNSETVESITTFINWITTGNYTLENANYIWLIIAKSDDSVISNDELLYIKNSITVEDYTLKTQIELDYRNSISDEIYYNLNTKCLLTVESGNYSDFLNGQTVDYVFEVASTSRARSDTFVNLSYDKKVKIAIAENSQYNWGYFGFDKYDNFIKGFWYSDTKILPKGYKYKLVFKAADGSVLDSNDLASILSDFTVEYIEEESDDEVPAYWVSALDTAISKVRPYIDGDSTNKIMFFYISDIHYPMNNGNAYKLVKYLNDKLKVNMLINCGDSIQEASTKEVALSSHFYVHDNMKKSIQYYLPVVGNHDDNCNFGGHIYSERLTNAEFYNYIFSDLNNRYNVVMGETGKYYYFDDKFKKVRFIVLDEFHPEDWLSNPDNIKTYSFGNVQLNWIVNALNIPANWVVIPITHMPFTSATDGSILVEMVEDYNNKVAGSSGAISWNFTLYNGEIPCIFTGHTHYDIVTTLAGVPCVAILNDGTWNYDTPEYPQPERVPSTNTEQALDIVVLNRTTRVCNLIRVGAGSDREFTF